MTRTLFGLPAAALVTTALFLLMYGLIRPAEVVEIGARTAPVVVPSVPPDTEVVPEPRPATTVELPALPEAPARDYGDQPGGTVVSGLPAAGALTGGAGEVDVVLGTPLLAISSPAPAFPPSCQSRGTEGFATVAYDVTLRGAVTNARVVDSSYRCFERAALRAIESWRYRPAMTTAQGFLATGKTQRFAFTLSE